MDNITQRTIDICAVLIWASRSVISRFEDALAHALNALNMIFGLSLQWLGFEAACDGDIVDTNDIQQLDCILIHLLTADSELAVVESWAACLMNPVL